MEYKPEYAQLAVDPAESAPKDRLARLGFVVASERVKTLKEKARKLAIAYEHYRFVRPEKINAFNEKLRKTTEKRDQWGVLAYNQLVFTHVSAYEKVPPADVLDKLEEAQNRNCFDTFEVAHIQSVTEVPDPILFGRITGFPDRFYIAQWDNDVKIEDILKDNEG